MLMNKVSQFFVPMLPVGNTYYYAIVSSKQRMYKQALSGKLFKCLLYILLCLCSIITNSHANDTLTIKNALSDIAVDEDSTNTVVSLLDVFTDSENEDALIIKTIQSNSHPNLVTAIIENNILILSYQPDQNGFSSIVVRGTSKDQTIDDEFFVTVNAIDDDPIVLNEISDITTDEDTPFSFSHNSMVLISNVFTDIDNDDTLIIRTIESISKPELVSINIEGNYMIIKYQQDQYGTATIVIRGISNNKYVDEKFQITVNPVDDPPVLSNPISNIVENEDAEDTIISLDNVFSDIDSSITKTIQSNSNPELISVTINENTLRLDFLADQFGQATIVIAGVSNNKKVEDSFKVTVNPVDDPPIISNPIVDITVFEDAENTIISLENVFTDVDNDDSLIVKSIKSNSNPDVISASINNNSLILDFLPDQYGEVTFVLVGSSNNVIIDESFIVHLIPVNDSPVAQSGKDQTVNEGSQVILDASDSFDIDNPIHSYTWKQLNGITVVLFENSTTAVYFTAPETDITGQTLTFELIVTDSEGLTAVDNINILVKNIENFNDAPIAYSQEQILMEDSSLNITLSATDKEGSPLEYTIVQEPEHGTIVGNLPHLKYTPGNDFSGQDMLTFKVYDGELFSNTATHMFNVENINDPPIALQGVHTTAFNSNKYAKLYSVDVDSDALSYKILQQPEKGYVRLIDQEKGYYRYFPYVNVKGVDQFAFATNDGNLNSNTAIISVNIIESYVTNEIFQIQVNLSGDYKDNDTYEYMFLHSETGEIVLTETAQKNMFIANLQNGNYRLIITGKGYVPYTYNETLESFIFLNKNKNITAYLKSDPNFNPDESSFDLSHIVNSNNFTLRILNKETDLFIVKIINEDDQEVLVPQNKLIKSTIPDLLNEPFEYTWTENEPFSFVSKGPEKEDITYDIEFLLFNQIDETIPVDHYHVTYIKYGSVYSQEKNKSPDLKLFESGPLLGGVYGEKAEYIMISKKVFYPLVGTSFNIIIKNNKAKAINAFVNIPPIPLEYLLIDQQNDNNLNYNDKLDQYHIVSGMNKSLLPTDKILVNVYHYTFEKKALGSGITVEFEVNDGQYKGQSVRFNPIMTNDGLRVDDIRGEKAPFITIPLLINTDAFIYKEISSIQAQITFLVAEKGDCKTGFKSENLQTEPVLYDDGLVYIKLNHLSSVGIGYQQDSAESTTYNENSTDNEKACFIDMVTLW